MIREQVAIVTGASRGLGRFIAQALAREGVRVAVAARTEHEVRSLAEEIGGFSAVLDVRDYSQCEKVTDAVRQHFGAPVDILINNAGLGWYKPFLEWSVEEIDRTIDVNLKGTVYMTRCALPSMLERGSGQIVNIASDLGRRVIPNMAPYVASKFAVVGFSGSLLREVKGRGVKVMTLTPGIIDTYFGGGAEGTRDETWSMKPDFVARAVVDMLKLPQHWVIDEMSIHAVGQDF